VTSVALAVFLAVALSSVSYRDWPFDGSASFTAVTNYSGPMGSLLAWLSIELFGRVFAWLVPFGLLLLGLATPTRRLSVVSRFLFETAVLVVLLNAVFALVPPTQNTASIHGRVGDGVAAAARTMFGRVGAAIVLIAVLLLVLLSYFGKLRAFVNRVSRSKALSTLVPMIGRGVALAAGLLALAGRASWEWWKERRRARKSPRERAPLEAGELGELAAGTSALGHGTRGLARAEMPAAERAAAERAERPIEITSVDAKRRLPAKPAASPPKPPAAATVSGAQPQGPAAPAAVEREEAAGVGETRRALAEASLPSLAILQHGETEQESYSHEALRSWSGVLEHKLADYGVEGRVTAVHHGPVVTTFEYEPATGVRVKEIVSRADDLALAMKARSLRMIAPIPGRAAVGIEIPNPESRIVYLHDILEKVEDKQRLRGIMIGLGVDVVGKPFLMNLCEAPHLLIAGTTGSGKSVCLNAILASILFQYRPADVRLLLVDPKTVELTMYDGIPHLLHPVITDPKEAARVLEYLTVEMKQRNELFRHHGVKNIESYNTKIALGKLETQGERKEKLPYIVLMVDELGDLALAKGVDIETLLARLAQMARAAGIHMVLSTQRPSVDVIVGKTKANFPTRIAFRVATKVDSRTIIDTIGADKLLGKGDMLYVDSRTPVPLRLHGAWVSEKNIDTLIAHWKSYRYESSSLALRETAAGAAHVDDVLDPLFGDAKGVVIQYRQGSTSLLQRKLHIGYARAARLLDQLERSGVVGPPDGSKPREVYVDSIDEERV